MTPRGGKTGAVTISLEDGVTLTLEDTSFSFRKGWWLCVSDGWNGEVLCLWKSVLCVRVL